MVCFIQLPWAELMTAGVGDVASRVYLLLSGDLFVAGDMGATRCT